MLILLPPSEGKTVPRRGARLDLERLSLGELTSARRKVLEALVALSCDGAAAAKVLGLGPTQLDEIERNALLDGAATARADKVYSGVLYDALDVATMDTSARNRATRRVAIISSLFGMVRLGDPIPAYRLSGDVTLPGVGKVAAFWREHLDEAARAALGSGLLVDLRSSTYAAFWRPAADLAPRVVTMRVLHEHQGTRKVVSHFNKATKGRLVRALMEDGRDPKSPQALAEVLTDLGWTVEVGVPTAKGTQLDVVVAEL